MKFNVSVSYTIEGDDLSGILTEVNAHTSLLAEVTHLSINPHFDPPSLMGGDPGLPISAASSGSSEASIPAEDDDYGYKAEEG